MDPVNALAVVSALVVAATAAGLLWRARTGRLPTRAEPAAGTDLAAIAVAHGTLGREATLVQFSTEYCAPCRATSRTLGELASAGVGITHVEIDLSGNPELARRFGILQTPTTFVLDGAGLQRARIGGAPRMRELHALLDELTGAGHVGAR
ncbi:MAG: thioredoxin family protein [Micrococcales bacterium]|nr:thioredoxin family protein [Micrococcales bacterium]